MEQSKMLEYYNRFSTSEFEEMYHYYGDDLGAVWTDKKTIFRVWAPTASRVIIHLYKTGDGQDLFQILPMNRDVFGTWVAVAEGNNHGIYYTFLVTVDGETKETVDPYARAVGVNGNRGMIIDLDATNPEGFTEEQSPCFEDETDAIIYELHVRDFSAAANSGMKNKGKYLAFTEQNTVNSFGDRTGVDYLKELGITHVHLLPSFDYYTVDETRLAEEQFNWGYDPKNYNVPEGSYSSDPYHGEVRIKEFKQMIQALHRQGLRVVMDVVYNHTMEGVESNFNRIVPGYYYRMTQEGTFSNASGCGNETASERSMMRKFMIDSVVYWVKEYHIDGFRFDLMGIHDIQTMNEIRRVLNTVKPGILIYGEGWTGGLSTLPDWMRALKHNIKNMNPGIAAFNDNLRDAVKGSAFNRYEKGYVNGHDGLEESIKFGVAASLWHQGVDYGRVVYSSNVPWAAEPSQTVNYTSAHDNLTLWDKLALSNAQDGRDNRIRMNLLSAAIILTCQGIPFFQAGEEFLRSKPLNEEGTAFDENSYASPDAVNSLKWDLVTTNKEVVEYYKGMMALRQKYRGLRMATAEEIRENLKFLDWSQPNVISYLIECDGIELCVIYNANAELKTIRIPQGDWEVLVKGKSAGISVLETSLGGDITIEPISALILRQTLESNLMYTI